MDHQQQQDHDFKYGLTARHSYGALDRLRSCVAIVYTRQGRIAIAITVDDMS